jgi:Concanavalin A-like lectin/glucanases superfamily
MTVQPTIIPETIPFIIGWGGVELPTENGPELQVRLDDGTGAYPYDVSAYVHLPTALGVTRGRNDELGAVEASRLTLRLDNVDGRFTLGSPVYGVHVNQRIRVSVQRGATTSHRFTGYVQDWPTQWPTPTGSYAVANVTAIDRLPRLARRDLRSMLEQEILADEPYAYYTLGEKTGAIAAGDTSGNARRPLELYGSGAKIEFGTGTGPADNLPAPEFKGGQYLRVRYPNPPVLATGVTVEAYFATDDADGDLIRLMPRESTEHELYVKMAAGRLEAGWTATEPGFGNNFWMTSDGARLDDGELHHVAIGWRETAGPAAINMQMYVDGARQSMTYFGTGRLGSAYKEYRIGQDYAGTIAHLVIYPFADAYGESAYTDRIGIHAELGLGLTPGESSDERIARLARYGAIPETELQLDAGVLTSLPRQSTEGASVLDAMTRVEEAEGGTIFVDGEGHLVFQNRMHRPIKATSTPTLAVTSADVNHDDLTFSAEPQYLVNHITGTRENGAVQTIWDADSIETHEQHPDSLELLVNSDLEVLTRMQWRLARYAHPQPRLASVTLDLLTLPQTVQEAALRLELGDRLTVSGLPDQAPGATADLIIEGWSESLGIDAWQMTLNTSPASQIQVWVLGDNDFGLLGTTTRLHY